MTDNIPNIGHNKPPQSPFDVIEEKINWLYDEAKNWLDGEPITNQGMADDVNKLIGAIRKAEKDAEALRKEENKPFDEGKAAVQARYAPLIANTKAVKGKTVLALEAAKAALTPWLEKVEAKKRAKEEAARKEAEEAKRNAREAFAKAQADDLAAREKAEQLAKEAKDKEIAARKAAADKAQAKTEGVRATTLRTYYSHEITDATAFARYLWINHREILESFLNVEAKRMVSENPRRTIPGVKIIETKKAV